MKINPPIHVDTEFGEGFVVEMADDESEVIVELKDGRRIAIRGDTPADLYERKLT